MTSDLSGFGSYVQKHVWPGSGGTRTGRASTSCSAAAGASDDACDALVHHLFSFAQLTRRQRIEMRNRTERLGEQFDWSTLVDHYTEAHNLALERVGPRGRGSWTCGSCEAGSG